MSLIEAKHILWNEIIGVMKTICESLVLISEEKIINRDLQELVLADKQKMHDSTIWDRKLIYFVNSKSDQELGEHEIQYRTLYVLEINKVIVNNAHRKSA